VLILKSGFFCFRGVECCLDFNWKKEENRESRWDPKRVTQNPRNLSINQYKNFMYDFKNTTVIN
jgi:hypothetical protein